MSLLERQETFLCWDYFGRVLITTLCVIIKCIVKNLLTQNQRGKTRHIQEKGKKHPDLSAWLYKIQLSNKPSQPSQSIKQKNASHLLFTRHLSTWSANAGPQPWTLLGLCHLYHCRQNLIVIVVLIIIVEWLQQRTHRAHLHGMTARQRISRPISGPSVRGKKCEWNKTHKIFVHLRPSCFSRKKIVPQFSFFCNDEDGVPVWCSLARCCCRGKVDHFFSTVFFFVYSFCVVCFEFRSVGEAVDGSGYVEAESSSCGAGCGAATCLSEPSEREGLIWKLLSFGWSLLSLSLSFCLCACVSHRFPLFPSPVVAAVAAVLVFRRFRFVSCLCRVKWSDEDADVVVDRNDNKREGNEATKKNPKRNLKVP